MYIFSQLPIFPTFSYKLILLLFVKLLIELRNQIYTIYIKEDPLLLNPNKFLKSDGAFKS